MEKQMTVKETNKSLAAFAMTEDDDLQIDSEDILIPKLLLMQGLSKFVTDEYAGIGDIVSSVTKEVLSSKGQEVDAIPLMHFKTWTLFDADDSSQFVASIPFTAANSSWNRMDAMDWEGRLVKPFATINVYVLLKKDLGTPGALPHLVSFRSTSYRAGKQMMNHFLMCKQARLHPASHVVGIGGTKTKNDKGTYYVYDVSPKEKTDSKHVEQIMQWVDILKADMHKIDEEAEFKKETTPEAKVVTDGEEY